MTSPVRRAFPAVVLGAALAVAAPPAVADVEPDWTAKLVARADVIAAEVAKIRGLAVKRPIAKGVMAEDALRARLLARMDEDAPPAERARDAAVAKRWGLVPMATDLDALIVDLLTEQIAGFYDPAEGKLYVSAKPGSDDTWADMLMAHELTHALQDQHFGLAAWMKVVDGDDDASAARQALVEGDGVALMIEYTLAKQGQGAPWDHELVVRMIAANMNGAGGGPELERAPVALREAMLFPYRAGVGFVAALRKGRPWSAIDDVYRRPPRSTEQVLHPHLYLADARPDQITAPRGADVLDASTWGEEGWRTFLVTHGVPPVVAAGAAAGWGGDRVVLRGRAADVATPARTVGVAVVTWDTAEDADEFWNAASHALASLAGGPTTASDPSTLWWRGWRGRVTALARRDRTVAIVTGAPLGTWRATLADAWRWPVTWAAQP
jgi:hypothetical protein